MLWEAFRMLAGFDPELWDIVGRSLLVSVLAVGIAGIVAIPAGAVLGLARDTRLNRTIISTANALMGLPPVVAGLLIYMVLTRNGPLGEYQLLFTVTAMVIVQLVLALPIILSLTSSAVRAVDPGVSDAARTLGASRVQSALAVLREARSGLVTAVAAGLGRVLAEVGAVMLVGGNIAGRTRVMTTAIMLETRQGNFEMALGLGMILIILSLGLNFLMGTLSRQQGGSK